MRCASSEIFPLIRCLATTLTLAVSSLGAAADQMSDPPDLLSKTEREKTQALTKLLLKEQLARRDFLFADVVAACADQQVLPLSDSDEPVIKIIHEVMNQIAQGFAAGDPDISNIERINEVSRLLEDLLRAKLNAHPELSCDLPKTVKGTVQRSGYPDLLLTHRTTGRHYYLDPKLLAQGSEGSTFRSFYFEPKDDTLKITHDAVHLLIGITHDRQRGAWKITGWRLIDLSTLRVRLKAEFQASNQTLYDDSVLSLPTPTQ